MGKICIKKYSKIGVLISQNRGDLCSKNFGLQLKYSKIGVLLYSLSDPMGICKILSLSILFLPARMHHLSLWSLTGNSFFREALLTLSTTNWDLIYDMRNKRCCMHAKGMANGTLESFIYFLSFLWHIRSLNPWNDYILDSFVYLNKSHRTQPKWRTLGNFTSELWIISRPGKNICKAAENFGN